MKIRSIFWFWGVMDFIYVVHFCYVNISQGRIPLYDDMQSFMLLSLEQGAAPAMLFALSFALNVSIVVSMILFCRGSHFSPGLVYIQMPLRLLLSVPSLVFIPWLAEAGALSSIGYLLGLLLLSETIKFFSILFRNKIPGLLNKHSPNF